MAATSSLVALTLATASATAQPAVTPAPLSIASIKNAMYLVPPSAPSDPGTIVQLQDGAYAEDADGVAVRLYRDGQVSATGDLNADGVPDLATVFVQALPGENDALEVVVAYLNIDGQPQPAASIAVGDRTDAITSLSIRAGQLTVSGLVTGPNDPLCCPHQPFSQNFSLQGDQLVASAGQSLFPSPNEGQSPIDGSPLSPAVCMEEPPPHQGGDPSTRVKFYGGGATTQQLCSSEDPTRVGWFKVAVEPRQSDQALAAVCYLVLDPDSFVIVRVRNTPESISSTQGFCTGLGIQLQSPVYFYADHQP